MTELRNEKLSPWYFAVRYASMYVNDRIIALEVKGLDATYDKHVLNNLAELEQFLKMSWDTWMDELEASVKAAQEVK